MTRTWDTTRPIYYGSATERTAFPASGESAGAVFFDLDDETLYYWDGAAWQSVGGGGWKLGNTIVVSTSGNGDYATLAAAFAAASSGDTILVDVEGGIACDNLTLPAGVKLRGLGIDITTLSANNATQALTLNADCVLQNVTVLNQGAGHAITLGQTTVYLRHVGANATGGGNAIHGNNAVTDIYLYNCYANASSLAAGDGLHLTGNDVGAEMYGGRYRGRVGYDVYVGDNATSFIDVYEFPVFPNGTKGGSGYVDGWWFHGTLPSHFLVGDNVPAIHMKEVAAKPGAPYTSNFWRLYFKSDGLYVEDDAGTETGPLGVSGAPAAAQYLTLALDAGLSAERVLTAGEGIDFADTGADGTLTIDGEDATAANKGIASFSADHFSVAAGAVSLAADGIDDTLIDWGTGAGQVSAGDIPIADAGNYFATDNVEAALQTVGGVDPASHTHSKLVASDGAPDPALSAAADGALSIAAGLTLTFASGGATVNEFSTDDTLGGDSNTALPTEAAVKGYVDTWLAQLYYAELRNQPGLVGLWTMASVQRSTGLVYDGANQSRNLTYNGNPVFKILSPTTFAIPYVDFDGTGDYLSRTDETDLDILGSETIFGSPGLSMCCWVKFDNATPGANEIIMSKWGAAGQRSYMYYHQTDGTILFQISTDGTANTSVNTTGTTGTGWVFVGGRFVPSTSVDVYLGVGGAVEHVANTTSVPATIFNSTTEFDISGRTGGTNLLTGNLTMAVLAANAWDDAVFTRLYNHGRVLFGV